MEKSKPHELYNAATGDCLLKILQKYSDFRKNSAENETVFCGI